jgi:incFII family plasmid replication initiator RepA
MWRLRSLGNGTDATTVAPVLDALLQAMCFHYDPLANRVQLDSNMAIECGLATGQGAADLSVSRASGR